MARLFDGVDQSLGVATPVTDYPFTFGCWARPDTGAANLSAMSIGDASAGSPYLRLSFQNVSGLVACLHWNGSASDLAETSASYTVGQWHYISCVCASATSRSVTIDGANDGSSSTNRTLTNIDNFTIAVTADSTPLAYFNGAIAEPVVYNVALLADEVYRLAQGEPALFIRPQDRVAYWPLTDGSDFEWLRRYDLTAFNSPDLEPHPPKVLEHWNRVRMRAVSTQSTTPLVSWSIPNVWTPQATPFHPSVAVTPAAVTAVAATVDPTVILGSVAITPTEVSSVGAVVAPTVELSSVTVAPAVIDAVAATVDPTVELGSLTIAPGPTSAIGATVDPGAVLGSVTITPTAVAGVGTVVAPTVELSSITIAPDPVTSISTTVAPTVELGSISFTPTEVAAVGAVVAPDVVLGSIAIEPTEVDAVGATVDPTIVLSSVTITPATVDAVVTTVDPTVLADVIVTPAPVSAIGAVVAPTVELGSIVIVPDNVNATGAIVDPDVVLGSMVITPGNAWVVTTTVDPTVIAPVGIVVTLPERTATLSAGARDTTVTAPERTAVLSAAGRDTSITMPERSATVRIKGQ